MAEYIERENAIDEIKKYALEAYDIDLDDSQQFAGNSTGEKYCEGLYEATEILEEVPTADVAEVKHGKWEYDPNGMDWQLGAWVCSLCKVKNDNLGGSENINPYMFAGSKFCPHCGAKMDGKEGVEMTEVEFAKILNGREYGLEMTPAEERQAEELGLVVVFGYSDDNAEFRGAIYDEIGCYDGGRVFERGDKYIDAKWCDGEYSWMYDTNIPHAVFDIYEDGEKFCRGIVFKESEVQGE